ncbi:MAG: RNA polymerase subunit sigma, partial [Acidobacteria bacterium]|nr:RNA polymerase subunit sigma [Acidobacteriota bacterium]
MSRLLHVLNGDCTRRGVERSGVPGDLTVWADVLHDGPTPAGLSGEAWRSVRARHLASLDGQSEGQILEQLQRWDAALDRYREYDEVVFWLEHDLFDQLLLIRHLHWISRLEELTGTTFSLICIDRFPGVEHFTGLGPLRPEQLATLLDIRKPISEPQVALGQAAWDAYCAPEPLGLQQWLD